MPRWLEARKWAQQSGLGRALNLLTRVLGISVILTGGDDSTSMCLRTTNDHPVNPIETVNVVRFRLRTAPQRWPYGTADSRPCASGGWNATTH